MSIVNLLNCLLASCYANQTQQTGAEEPDGWGDGDRGQALVRLVMSVSTLSVVVVASINPQAIQIPASAFVVLAVYAIHQ